MLATALGVRTSMVSPDRKRLDATPTAAFPVRRSMTT